ncbi:zinc finger, RING/FYVE/PHD-type, Transmembrane Fragile-X-F-associated protein [Artemisia annua]|uniref:Zinc finger, RING/FYVE/PHD-type, Transmembrane Fragile-X-F-associated protein n=1 Tax=Artemisia annua TaxID=35608 RepID=A0A2U1KCY3_ARTAN|nr:zinc finger, RING/FYVE/PHD-type, Transmembrane Fragile-X-F-associated protein [Artemisia annua]
MSWNRVSKSLQAFAAHTSLFCFTLLLVLKLDHLVSYSWWIIFLPLFLFHAVVARGRFSLPAPSVPHGRHWAPFHVIVATPLLIAFELLLCVFLESIYDNKDPTVSLKIVFLPLLAFEITILIDNFRMCKALLPGDDERLSDDAIWETLPHFWVAISMVFFVAATVFTLLKLCVHNQHPDADETSVFRVLNRYSSLVSNHFYIIAILTGFKFVLNRIAECFAFLVCTKWSNPVIHRNSQIPVVNELSTEDISEYRTCGIQDIGGHVVKIPIIGFQVLLFMRLEGKPAAARLIPLPVVFSPVFLVQGLGVLISASNFVERIVILLRTGAGTGRYFTYAARARDSFGFLHRGSRLLGWWSTDEGSREEQARIYYNSSSGQVQFSALFLYNTFSGYPPELVKRLPKKDLTEEVWRLQAALSEQTEITKSSQQNYERLQNEKVLCRVCFEREINTVLLPCRHHILCSICSEKCQKCPVCRVSIDERLPVYDI